MKIKYNYNKKQDGFIPGVWIKWKIIDSCYKICRVEGDKFWVTYSGKENGRVFAKEEVVIVKEGNPLYIYNT